MKNKYTLIFVTLLGLFSEKSFACSCTFSNHDYFSNIELWGWSKPTHVLAVFDEYVSFDTLAQQKTGRFLLINTIESTVSIPDTFYLTLGTGNFCEEQYSVFNEKDTTFLSFAYHSGNIILEGLCFRNYLKVKNGNYHGLNIAQISDQIRTIISKKDETVLCKEQWAYDFYDNVAKSELVVRAKFKGMDYSYSEGGIVFQTARFNITKSFGGNDYSFGDDIVVLGANGLVFGLNMANFGIDSSFYLVLDPNDNEKYGRDTFYLKDNICGFYSLEVRTNKIEELDIKMNNIVLATEKLTNNTLNIYPTICEDKLVINHTNSFISKIEVYNNMGVKVYELSNLNDNELELNTSLFETGVHIIHVYSEDQVIRKNFVKK
jgi:hypothetical protein